MNIHAAANFCAVPASHWSQFQAATVRKRRQLSELVRFNRGCHCNRKPFSQVDRLAR